MALRYFRSRYNKSCIVIAVITSFVTPIYFYGFFQYAPINRKSIQNNNITSDVKQNLACISPQLELWNPIIRKYFKDVPPLKCSSKRDWVHVMNGTFLISQQAVQSHGNISCEYIPLLRGRNDFTVENGPSIRPMTSGQPLQSNFFKAVCEADDGAKYSNIHAGIAYRSEISERFKNNPLPDAAHGLNILMFGLDSTSRMTWLRNLPKTHQYFVQHMNGVVMEGYNIIGDGTPAALLPILTGHREEELPEARRGHRGATTVDGHPFIWKKLQDIGYTTQWGEEQTSMGTFTLRLLGFKDQPVDHYMRTFYLHAAKEYSANKPYCLGSTPRHMIMLNWIKELYAVYPNQPKFSFLFHAEYSHEGNSESRWVDDDLLSFLIEMENLGHLNNTLLILMADHGARFQEYRKTLQGKYEERMPYMALRLPYWFKNKHPDIIQNLNINSHRLTTPFDIQATFLDLIHATNMSGKSSGISRGISLFKEVPASRTCADAGIEPHWCACLNWKTVSKRSPAVTAAANHLVDVINNILTNHQEACHLLQISDINNAVMYTHGDSLLKFKSMKDDRSLIPDLSDSMKAAEVLYQLTIITKPGNGMFEATIKHDLFENKFKLNDKAISRINKYGNQPHCVQNKWPHLRPYCYCHKQFQAPVLQ